MLINSIELRNFRNYEYEKIDINPNINIFYGDNAQGKTNIIEAIFFTAFGKSFRTNKELEVIKSGEDFSTILINYKNNVRNEKIQININEKKVVLLNDIKIKRLSEILGHLNIVLFAPDDINILKYGPARRRKFLDMMIGQIRPNYVYNLNMYLKVLEQRNNYLKQVKINNNLNENMIKIWDEKLVEYGVKVCKYRQEFIDKIKEKIDSVHKEITENREEINIEYVTECFNEKDFANSLIKNRKIDIIKGYTTKGVQKDDFIVYINKQPVNVYGSQGQNRTVILSLKLCELQIIKEETGESPILLLDDFMSELDEKRVNNFLRNIKETQVIITCTEELKGKIKNKTLYQVNNGKIKINNMKEV